MGLKGLLFVFTAWVFSFFILQSGILPYWITSNSNLLIFTYIIWFIGFAIAFFKFGMEI